MSDFFRLGWAIWMGYASVWGCQSWADTGSCVFAILRFYESEEHARVEAVLSRLDESQRKELLAALAQTPADNLATLRNISSAYLHYIYSTIPDFLREEIQAKQNQMQLIRATSPSEENEADWELLKTDPMAGFAKSLAYRQEAEISVETITLHRELYGIRVSYMVDLLREINRLIHNRTLPWWGRIAPIALTHPLPVMTLGGYQRHMKLASLWWAYLALIPRSLFPLIHRELSLEEAQFLQKMTREDGKRKIRNLFEEVEQLMIDISAYPTQAAFEQAQAQKFHWGKELAIDYAFKLVWYGIIVIALLAN